MVHTLSFDAAFSVAPATQSKPAGSKASLREDDNGSFGDTLSAVTAASEDAATANAVVPTQVAASATEARVAVPTELQLMGDTSETSATGEPQPDGAAATPDPATIAAVQAAELPQGAAATSAAALPPTSSAATAQPAGAAMAAAMQAGGRTSDTSTGNKASAPVGDSIAADGIDSAGVTPAGATNANTATLPVAPAENTTGETSTESATTTSQQSLDSAGEGQQAEAPKLEAKASGQPVVAPAAASTQTAAQAQMKAQAADIAIQAADAAQSASATQSAAPDQLTSSSPTTTDTARAQATPAALQSAPAATLQVYARMIERADGRAQRFEIRLDPAELGRVDVRIEVGADRKVHAVLAAHDSAALTDLMRGQRALERALSDAGIDLAENGVRFELATDNGRSGAGLQRDNDGNPAPSANVWRNFDVAALPVSAEAAAAATPAWRTQRLDLVA